MKEGHIVLGLGYGDEGKGHMVDYFARRHPQSLVIRFNGSCQAGHTVVLPDGIRHVFSHFGSGTFAGASTYWSKFCPMNPLALVAEAKVLIPKLNKVDKKYAQKPWRQLGLIFIDPRCPVITPWDIEADRATHSPLGRHMTVGAGVGATLARHESLNPVKIRALDLKYPDLLLHKLEEVAKYYGYRDQGSTRRVHESFLAANCSRLVVEPFFSLHGWQSIIFEGAQGILLDKDWGVFPYVTRSKTTCHNVRKILEEFGWAGDEFDTTYATRSYLTRHGDGPLPQEGKHDPRIPPCETNQTDEFQGKFRFAPLNHRLVDFAVEANRADAGIFFGKSGIAMTCMDHFTPDIPLYEKANFMRLYESRGPTYKDVVELG